MSREEALQQAIDMAEDGDVIVVCRSSVVGCSDGHQEDCEFCARVSWVPGLTASDLMQMALSS